MSIQIHLQVTMFRKSLMAIPFFSFKVSQIPKYLVACKQQVSLAMWVETHDQYTQKRFKFLDYIANLWNNQMQISSKETQIFSQIYFQNSSGLVSSHVYLNIYL